MDEKGVRSPSFRELGGLQAGCYSNMLEELIKYCPSTRTNEGEAEEVAMAKATGGDGSCQSTKDRDKSR